VLEIDGKSHDYQKEHDELRTYIINNLEIEVVRFKNEEIEKGMSSVLERLRQVLTHPKFLSQKERDLNSPSLRKRSGRG